MVKIDVFTCLCGYEYFVFQRFVGTLYDSGFSGNTWIVCKQSDLDKIYTLQKTYKNVKYFIDNLTYPTSPNIKRYRLYKEIISQMKQNKPEYILMCDGRDVLFQRNIESFEYDHDLYFAEEPICHSECPLYNSRWVKAIESLTGEPCFNYIKDKKALCSGTTLGNFSSIQLYLDMMVGIINKYNMNTCHHGQDQGNHNYLYYTNKFPKEMKIKLVQNKDVLFNTIGAALSLKKYNMNSYVIKNGQIYDKENLSYVVHQWDRLNSDERELISLKYNFNLKK